MNRRTLIQNIGLMGLLPVSNLIANNTIDHDKSFRQQLKEYLLAANFTYIKLSNNKEYFCDYYRHNIKNDFSITYSNIFHSTLHHPNVRDNLKSNNVYITDMSEPFGSQLKLEMVSVDLSNDNIKYWMTKIKDTIKETIIE